MRSVAGPVALAAAADDELDAPELQGARNAAPATAVAAATNRARGCWSGREVAAELISPPLRREISIVAKTPTVVGLVAYWLIFRGRHKGLASVTWKIYRDETCPSSRLSVPVE